MPSFKNEKEVVELKLGNNYAYFRKHTLSFTKAESKHYERSEMWGLLENAKGVQ